METAIKNSYSIGDGKTFLEPSALNALPSIVARHQGPKLSDRYEFIDTMGVVTLLAREGWLPVKAQEQRIRTKEREGFQKHLIRFRQPLADRIVTLDGLSPEMILSTSHDGLNAWNFYAGFIKWICMNGLIVSAGLFSAIRIKHFGHHGDQIIEATQRIAHEFPALADRVNTYNQITLEPFERKVFAEAALITRFAPSMKDEIGYPLDPNDHRLFINGRTFLLNQLLAPRREAEQAPTLWNTFNTVQEKIIQGNAFENTVRTEEGGGVKIKRKVKGINSINENLRINRGLWHLMDRMATSKNV